ncbi:MAG: FecR family protein, partial [Acidobacteriota bacterium]
MNKKKLIACLACAVLLAAPAFLRASRNYRVVNGPDGLYYGHISYTEAKSDGKDPVVRREGETGMEAAVLNLPVGPGDTILTPADRRCEIQFDSGTILRLDVDTELRIETVNAQSLSSSARLSNLVLVRGRIYAMYKQYDRRETFQILTPNTAVKLGHKTVAVIRAAGDGSTDIQVKYGKANAMFGRDDQSIKQGPVKKAERLIVLADYQFQRSTYVPDTAFDLWNDEINANFDKLHQGQSALPKPVQNLPGAVFYFAQNYGNMYGEWLWDELYGYVWRPYRNQMQYPWGWAPYYYGRWSSYGGQMYWVPEEPWGWIPYHLGIWQWDAKLGWVWMPGSLFAPAWVQWEFFFGYCGWRPWGLYDWFDSFGTGFGYWDGGWSYGYLGTYEGASLYGPLGRPFLYNAPKNKLQQTDALTTAVPREIKSIKASVLAAYKRGDQRVLESVKQAASH